MQRLEPLLRAQSASAEREHRLPDVVGRALRDAGLYTLAAPKALGGRELDPMSAFRVIEELARFDSAAGWNVQLSTGCEPFGAWLPREGVEEIFTSGLVLGGTLNPPAQLVPVDGGYRITGRSPFVSGCHQCEWFFAPATITEAGATRMVDGEPALMIAYFPAAEAEIIDNWDTLGMCGTGSHDVAITDVFIPARWTAPLVPLETPNVHFEGPLYRLKFWSSVAAWGCAAAWYCPRRNRRLRRPGKAEDAGVHRNPTARASHGPVTHRAGGGGAGRRAGIRVRGAPGRVVDSPPGQVGHDPAEGQDPARGLSCDPGSGARLIWCSRFQVRLASVTRRPTRSTFATYTPSRNTPSSPRVASSRPGRCCWMSTPTGRSSDSDGRRCGAVSWSHSTSRVAKSPRRLEFVRQRDPRRRRTERHDLVHGRRAPSPSGGDSDEFAGHDLASGWAMAG